MAIRLTGTVPAAISPFFVLFWSGRRDSNPRPSAPKTIRHGPEPVSGGETVSLHPPLPTVIWICAATGLSGLVVLIAVPTKSRVGAPWALLMEATTSRSAGRRIALFLLFIAYAVVSFCHKSDSLLTYPSQSVHFGMRFGRRKRKGIARERTLELLLTSAEERGDQLPVLARRLVLAVFPVLDRARIDAEFVGQLLLG